LRIVLKLTGKVFEHKYSELLQSLASLIIDISKKHELAVVIGGGPIARSYIRMARSLNLSEAWCDIIAIEVTRINAKMFIALLNGYAYNEVPRNINEFLEAWSSGKIVVLGGLQPGQSTSAVAALIAEIIKADLLIYATDVDGIYDKDPKKYPDAKKKDIITLNELRKVLSQRVEAGTYELIDPLAMIIIGRSKIKTIVLSAFKPEAIEKAIIGEKVGTEIIP